MALVRGPVLLDTNAMIECWRLGCWRALSNGLEVETVEYCVEETQTGQRRRDRVAIDEKELRASMRVHGVTDVEEATASLKDDLFGYLDGGEKALWAHALGRPDRTWRLGGPDKTSLRFGVRVGYRDCLVSLEHLLAHVGIQKKTLKLLRPQYTEAWHASTLNTIVIEERPRKL